MTRLVPSARLVLLLAAALPACDHHSVAEPDRMYMEGMVEAYHTPTAALDQRLLDHLADSIGLRIDLASGGNPLGYVSEHVIEPALLGSVPGDSDSDAERNRDRGRGRYGIRAAGFARIGHVCEGQQPAHPVDRVSDGWLELYVTFSQGGVDPVVSGKAAGCRYGENGRETYINGDLGIHRSEKIFYLGGNLFINGKRVVSDGIDFRVANGGLEFRLPSEQGHVLFTVGKRLLFRATNGSWECELLKGRCTHDGSDSVLSFSRGKM